MSENETTVDPSQQVIQRTHRIRPILFFRTIKCLCDLHNIAESRTVFAINLESTDDAHGPRIVTYVRHRQRHHDHRNWSSPTFGTLHQTLFVSSALCSAFWYATPRFMQSGQSQSPSRLLKIRPRDLINTSGSAQSVVTSTESAFDPALSLPGGRANGACSGVWVVGRRAIQFDGLTRVVRGVAMAGNWRW